MKFPIRINRYLASQKYCSRRQADKLIEQKLVKINGRIARLGDPVFEDDKVEVSSKILKGIAEKRLYLAYHKPAGVVTHPTGLPGERSIKDIIPHGPKLFPIGRLDKASHGLIILTNDGRITDKLLNPENLHEKEYVVRVDKKLRPFFLRHLESGVDIEGYQTKPAKVEKLNDDAFRIVLTEGKHHQIRRMAAAFDYAVRDLKRTRILNIELDTLKPGEYREIKGQDLESFLQGLGL